MSASRCLLLLVILLLTACAGAPTRPSPEEAQMAESMYSEGDFANAAQAFLDAAENSRSGRDYYRLRAAEAWREEGDLKAASAALQGANPRRLDADAQIRMRLLQAELALAEQQPATAVAALDLVGDKVSPRYRARYLELRGRTFEMQRDPLGAAREYARLDELLQGRERSENARRIRALLGSLNDQQLRTGASQIAAQDALRPFAARALRARGMEIPAQLTSRDSTPRTAPAPGGIPQRIALLLPQTGPLQAAAQPVRDGFLSAYYAAPDPRPEIVLVDSGDTPEQAIEAYRQAVRDGADAVVGPLGREAVTSLLGQNDLPVPVLALNRSATPLPPGQASFALAPDEEAAAVATRLRTRGLMRIMTVVAADDSAQRALGGFRTRLQQAGGSIVAEVVLPEGTVDFQPAIRAALERAGLPTSAPTSLDAPHDAGFDAVFLAVRPTQARLAVPQLRTFGLGSVPMLGTSMLHAADEANRLDRDLEGIEFAEAPWLVADLPGLPSRQTLSVELDSARGPAARLFAFGMDAYRLLMARDAIDEDHPLEGATGRVAIDPFGEARRDPGIARFHNGRAQLVHDAELVPSDVGAGSPR